MEHKKALGICVKKNEAETVRQYLREHHLLRNDLLLKRRGEWIYFPIEGSADEVLSYRVVSRVFEARDTKPASYKELVDIPPELKDQLPTSYDVIGDILLIKIPRPLSAYHTQIGSALLQAHPHHIKTVCLVDPVSGELRTRNVTVIAGEQKTQTVHREYGLSFLVDVRTTYFSPRLASERWRIARVVQPGEVIVDLFAGVAPFSIMIARYARPQIVYAIDKNTDAVALARENVKQNHVLERVEVISADAGDAARIVPRKADRIIMNLPFSAHLFFSSALALAGNRCVIHYYDILKDADIQPRIEFLTQVATASDFHLSDVSPRRMKSYATREFYIGIDITATKHADVA